MMIIAQGRMLVDPRQLMVAEENKADMVTISVDEFAYLVGCKAVVKTLVNYVRANQYIYLDRKTVQSLLTPENTEIIKAIFGDSGVPVKVDTYRRLIQNEVYFRNAKEYINNSEEEVDARVLRMLLGRITLEQKGE